MAWRISFFGDEIEEISEFDPLTGQEGREPRQGAVYANSHYVTPGPTMKQAMQAIRFELEERLKELHAEGRLLEAQRLEQRTNFDLEMIAATGSCAGSRTTAASSPAACRASRRRRCSNTCPKTRCCSSTRATRRCRRSARWRGRPPAQADAGRIRLPPAELHRQPPLRFNEWDAMRPQTFAVSATPGSWEMEQTGGVFAEQVIRPTGLIDPPVEIRPVEDQVQDCIAECKATAPRATARSSPR
jgi:excinuclease ABC subunit B